VSGRDYQAALELERVARCSAFTVRGAISREKINQHATLYRFGDGSGLLIRHTRGRGSAWHPGWLGRAGDAHLGPIEGLPLCINARGAA